MVGEATVAQLVEPISRRVGEVSGRGEVEIGLGGPAHVVASGAKAVGEERGRREQFRAHVVAADGPGVAAGDEGAAARGADGSGGEGAAEEAALSGEAVEVRGEGVGIAIATGGTAGVLADEEDDIRAGSGVRHGARKMARRPGAAKGKSGIVSVGGFWLSCGWRGGLWSVFSALLTSLYSSFP